MEATALIVFREVLEAALIITIVLAATRGLSGRFLWVSGGVAAGVLGSVLVALLAGAISNMAAGTGQELFNAGVLLAAVGMLSWHVVWMSKHGRELAAQMKGVGNEVASGERPVTALIVVIALAVLREGSEVVLFLQGLSASGNVTAGDMITGGAGGLVLGSLIGVGLYFGLVRIPIKYFFSATNWLITLLAAGLAAQSMRYLVQAGILSPIKRGVWDTSWLLSEQSWLGQILHILVGYMDRPSLLQVIVYVAVVVFLVGASRYVNRPVTQGNAA